MLEHSSNEAAGKQEYVSLIESDIFSSLFTDQSKNCPACEKKFSRKSNRNRHIKSHGDGVVSTVPPFLKTSALIFVRSAIFAREHYPDPTN
jgi:hypothetical protein